MASPWQPEGRAKASWVGRAYILVSESLLPDCTGVGEENLGQFGMLAKL